VITSGIHSHAVTAIEDIDECPNGFLVTSVSFEEICDPLVVGNAIIVDDVPSSIGKLNTDGAFSFSISIPATVESVCLDP